MDDRQRTHYCMHDGKSSTDPLPTLRQEMKAMRRLLLAAGLALALPAQATEIIVLAAPTTVGSQYSDPLYGKALGFFAEEGVDLQLAGFTGGSAVVVPQLACAVSARAVPRVAPHSASAARPARHQRLAASIAVGPSSSVAGTDRCRSHRSERCPGKFGRHASAALAGSCGQVPIRLRAPRQFMRFFPVQSLR